ncbi:MAG: zinc-dependent alcohol dehydrogenase [Acidobacteria bacterium]|nr:zinc-dependent alcohol dehydrogenase [Acidobacteriota bacterium]
MKAAILHDFAQPLTLEDVPTPTPGAGQVLVKVVASGVCHSDLHIALGDWTKLKPVAKLPLILGHEIAGTIAAVGEGVADFAIGDRVGVPWLHQTCGVCEYCQSGQETMCGKQKITGLMVDGGYAEYAIAQASHTAKIPDELSFTEAAPLLCAGVTVYRAIKVSGIRAGERLVIFGIGGLGHLAVQIGKKLGLEVGAVDIAEDKLQLATECGADWTVNAATTTAYKEIKARNGAHVAIVTSGSKAAYETALRSLRRMGTLVIVGMTPEPIPLDIQAMLAGEFKIMASTVGTRKDLQEVLQLAAESGIRCHYTTATLPEINGILDEMKGGKLVGRVVLTM